MFFVTLDRTREAIAKGGAVGEGGGQGGGVELCEIVSIYCQ